MTIPWIVTCPVANGPVEQLIGVGPTIAITLAACQTNITLQEAADALDTLFN